MNITCECEWVLEFREFHFWAKTFWHFSKITHSTREVGPVLAKETSPRKCSKYQLGIIIIKETRRRSFQPIPKTLKTNWDEKASKILIPKFTLCLSIRSASFYFENAKINIDNLQNCQHVRKMISYMKLRLLGVKRFHFRF